MSDGIDGVKVNWVGRSPPVKADAPPDYRIGADQFADGIRRLLVESGADTCLSVVPQPCGDGLWRANLRLTTIGYTVPPEVAEPFVARIIKEFHDLLVAAGRYSNDK